MAALTIAAILAGAVALGILLAGTPRKASPEGARTPSQGTRSPTNPNGILPQDERRRQRSASDHDSKRWRADYDRVTRTRGLAMLGAVMADPAFLDSDFEAARVEFDYFWAPGRGSQANLNGRTVEFSPETLSLLSRTSRYDDGMDMHGSFSAMTHYSFSEAQPGSATARTALRMARADLAIQAAEALRDALISIEGEEEAQEPYLRAVARINGARTAVGAIPLRLDWVEREGAAEAHVPGLGALRCEPRGGRHAAIALGTEIPLTFETAHAARAAAEAELRRIALQAISILGDGKPSRN